MNELLSCEALTKCYQKDKAALENVDLHIGFGRIVGCLAPTAAARPPSSSWRTVCCSPVQAASGSPA